MQLTHEQVVAFRLAREWLDQVQWTVDKNGPSVWYCQPSYRNDTATWLKRVHPESIHLEPIVWMCAQRMWPIAYDKDEGKYVFIDNIHPSNIQQYEDIAPFIPHFSV